MSTRRIIFIALAAVLSLALIAATLFIQQVSNGSLKLTTVPSDAKVTIDSRTKTHAGTITLSSGQHSVLVERDGFVPKTISVKIVAGKENEQSVALTVFNQTGSDYFSNHPDEVLQAEGITGSNVNKGGKEVTTKYPLISLLPYHGNEFDIDYGASQKHPSDQSVIAIYIRTLSDAGKDRALRWITSQGFDPKDYEIIYEADTERGYD